MKRFIEGEAREQSVRFPERLDDGIADAESAREFAMSTHAPMHETLAGAVVPRSDGPAREAEFVVALPLASELKADVILCDIGLPDIDGYEVARQVRRDRSLRATRLIAVSGYAQPENRSRSTEAGFDGLVAKPPDVEQLLGMLATRD